MYKTERADRTMTKVGVRSSAAEFRGAALQQFSEF